MSRYPDEYANITMDHLPPQTRREATDRKLCYSSMQEGREFLKSTVDGKSNPWNQYVDTYSQLEDFVGDALKALDHGPTLVILETRGDSDLWVKSRREFDGKDFYENGESTGVTTLLIKVTNRTNTGKRAFINMQRIIEQDLDGVPDIHLEQLFRHPNARGKTYART